jgi:hypothetical protein
VVGFKRCAGRVVGCYVTKRTGGHPGLGIGWRRPERDVIAVEALDACAVAGSLTEVKWSSF